MKPILLLLALLEFVCCNAQQRLYQRALENLKADCQSESTCSLAQSLTIAFDTRDYDGAFDHLLEKGTDCKEEECFFLSLLKAKILTEKGLVDKAISEYDNALALRNDLKELIGNEVYEIEQVLAFLHFKKKEYRTVANLSSRWLRDNADLGLERKKNLYHNLGISYLHLKKYDSSEYYLRKSISAKEELGDSLSLPVSYMDLANLYYVQYLDDQAIPLFTKALEAALKVKEEKPEVLANAYLNMAVVEENRNNHKKALDYRKSYEKVQKELWDRDKVWELAEKEKAYEVALRDKEIEVLEEQERAQEAELASQRWQINSYLIASFLLLAIAGITGWGYQKVRRTNRIVSDQKKELEQLNATKNRLFTIIAHDLKSPVVSLQKTQHKMNRAISAGDEVKIQDIASQNGVLLDNTYKLLNNTLQWALDQSNQYHFNPEPIEIDRLIDQVVYDYRGLIASKNISLKVSTGKNAMVSVDLQSIKTALRNLLDNSLKFTPAGGEIELFSGSEKDRARITVRDTGCGIDAARMEKLFDVDSFKVRKDTDGHTGTGLGLILAKTLVHRNKGALSVESQAGAGTSMVIELPLFHPAVVTHE